MVAYEVPIPVRLPEPLRVKVEQAAKERSIPRSVILREAIKFYFDHRDGEILTEDEVLTLIKENVGPIVEEKMREIFSKVSAEE